MAIVPVPTGQGGSSLPRPGGRYSFSDLKTLWVNEGGDPSKASLAAAVALAESAGKPDAENHNGDGSIDRGLWQINSIHGALSTKDIRGNARAAIQISKNGTDWSPWVTFKNKDYKKFLNGEPGWDKPTIDPKTIIPDPLQGLVDFVSKLGIIFEGKFWLRALLLFGGVALIGYGVMMIGKQYAPDVPLPGAAGVASKLIK